MSGAFSSKVVREQSYVVGQQEPKMVHSLFKLRGLLDPRSSAGLFGTFAQRSFHIPYMFIILRMQRLHQDGILVCSYAQKWALASLPIENEHNLWPADHVKVPGY